MKKRIPSALLVSVLLGMAVSVFAQPPASSGAKGTLAGLFSNSAEDELIEPDQAFKLKVATKNPTTILAELIPAKGYYLYKERIHFTLKDANGVSISGIKLPAGEMKVDQIYGKTEVYRSTVPVEIALNRGGRAGNVTLMASYQGCHEKLGVCYPPIQKTVSLALP